MKEGVRDPHFKFVVRLEGPKELWVNKAFGIPLCEDYQGTGLRQEYGFNARQHQTHGRKVMFREKAAPCSWNLRKTFTRIQGPRHY
jgi:hypothetical protein